MNWTRTLPVVLSAFAAACSQDPVATSEEPTLAATTATGWTSETPMTSSRQNAKAATVNGVIYVIGGGSRTVEAYNPTTKTWTTRRPLPEPLSPTGATNINGKIYVAGGFYGYSRVSRALYVYNPLTNAWVRKADLPSAIQRFAGHQGAISGKLYVYAGVTINPDGTVGPHRFFRYNPATNSWATLAPPGYARDEGASGVIDGRFYLIGGRLPTTRFGKGYAYDVHSYSPATGWTKKLLGPYSSDVGLAYATLGKRLYMFGIVYSDGCYYNNSRIYDPTSHTLLRFSSAPMRSNAVGAAAQGRFFLMGGGAWSVPSGDECGSFVGPTTAVLAYTP